MSPRLERVLHVAALLVATLTLALLERPELAATALGGALALVIPARVPPGAGVIGLGIGAGLLATTMTGCTPQSTLTALELARKLGDTVCVLCEAHDDDPPCD